MQASKADQEIKQVVRDLVSKDPVVFNSIINAHFASACTYKGRGVEIHGASQIKHAAWFYNLIDFGSGTKIQDQDIHWNNDATTAIIKAIRYVRPIWFPFFQFAVPTKLILTFHAEDDSKDTLYCTQWQEEGPTDKIVNAMPVVRQLYRALYVPAVTLLLLWVSNLAFFLHAKLLSAENRYQKPIHNAYTKRVEPRVPKPLVQGFHTGVHVAEKAGQQTFHLASSVCRGPLLAVERVAQTGVVVSNVFLPEVLQLPYPTIFDPAAKSSPQTEEKARSDKPQSVRFNSKSQYRDGGGNNAESRLNDETTTDSPKQKVAGSFHSDADKDEVQGKQTAKPHAHEEAQQDEETKRKAEQPPTEPRHAKVVVGPSEDGAHSQAKEIDVITQEVTEVASEKEEAGSSLYDQLKKDGELPTADSESHGDGSNGSAGKKKSSHKKKNKGGGKK